MTEYPENSGYITIGQDFGQSASYTYNYPGHFTINNDKKMDTSKYYVVRKDTPAWEAGAILKNTGGNGGYKAIATLWDKPCIETLDYHEAKMVVEGSDFFERVYAIEQDGKTVYTTKEKARDAVGKTVEA